MKNIIKIFIDIIMTILFFVLLGYSFTGRTIHEYLGFLIFAFFILHHILNFHTANVRQQGHDKKYLLVQMKRKRLNIH